MSGLAYAEADVRVLANGGVHRLVTVSAINEARGLVPWLLRAEYENGNVGLVCQYPRTGEDDS